MSLTFKKPLVSISEIEYFIPELELDSSVGILMRICEVFENSPLVSFIVGGFGQDCWPVDCRTDLCTVMEEVPEILKKTRGGIYFFELDFYEQGIERRLLFEEDLNLVKITCSSRTEWEPKPSSMVMTRTEVSNMFEVLYCTFIELANVICEGLENHPLLEEWRL